MKAHPQSFKKKSVNHLWVHPALIVSLAVIFFLSTHEFSKAMKYEKEGYYTAEETAALTKRGNIQRRVALLSLGAFGVVSLFSRRREQLRVNGFLGYTIIFFLFWAFASIAWTEDIGLTIRRLMILATLWVAALAIAARLSLRQIIFLTFIICAVFLIIGIYAELTLGTFHPLSGRTFAGHETGYRFAGTTDPNQGAWVWSMLVITSVFLASKVKTYRVYLISTALTAFLFLVLSKTRTSVAATLLSLVVYWGMTTSWPRKVLFASSLVFIICIMYFALGDELIKIVQYSLVLGRQDSDLATLSKRVPLWKDLLPSIREHPLLGFGYGAFWTAKRCLQFTHGDSSALNGYIDLLLALGVIGAGTYVLVLVFGIKRSITCYSRSGESEFLFAFTILLFHAVTMAIESMNFIASFPTFIVVCLIAKLGFGSIPVSIIQKDSQYHNSHRVKSDKQLIVNFYERC